MAHESDYAQDLGPDHEEIWLYNIDDQVFTPGDAWSYLCDTRKMGSLDAFGRLCDLRIAARQGSLARV